LPEPFCPGAIDEKGGEKKKEGKGTGDEALLGLLKTMKRKGRGGFSCSVATTMGREKEKKKGGVEEVKIHFLFLSKKRRGGKKERREGEGKKIALIDESISFF